MSIDALIYLKTLTRAPNGERVTLPEKAILWWLADGHSYKPAEDNPNGLERAAWYKVSTLAGGNGLSQRRTSEILQSLIRKRVIWREPRSRKDGSDTSNYWRFTVLDGDPTPEAIAAEEKRRLRGEMAAGKTNKLKHSRKVLVDVFPQSDPISTESQQSPAVTDRSLDCESLRYHTAEDRSLAVLEIAVSHRGGPRPSTAEDRSPRASSLSSTETTTDIREGDPSESSADLADVPAFCGNPAERAEIKMLWSKTVRKLEELRMLPNHMSQHLSNATFQRQSATNWLGNRWQVRVSVRDRAHVNFCERYRSEIEKAMELAGYPREKITLDFRVEQDASLPL
jgi:hypothetical protein